MITPSETNMTLFDFLAQAGFCQWLGILALASIIGTCFAAACQGLGKIRINSDNIQR
jgi:hypothetical protein